MIPLFYIVEMPLNKACYHLGGGEFLSLGGGWSLDCFDENFICFLFIHETLILSCS